MSKIPRRRFIGSAGAIAACSLLGHGCVSSTQQTIQSVSYGASASDELEVKRVRLGFIPLTDAAPLIIALEKGFFHKHGLTEAKLVRQASWESTRNNLVRGSAAGGIDGAHILSPMPYLMSAGTITSNRPLAMNILARLNLNGQGISLANIYRTVSFGVTSKVLKEKVEQAKNNGPGRRLKIAMTFPGGNHDLWIRYWLAAGGINPDKDVAMFSVPPSQMIANLKTGTIHMLCVGEPWNARIIRQNVGFSALTTGELWLDHPEKALAMRADWVERYPRAAKAVLMAVLEAQMWCDEMANRKEMCQIVSARKYFNVPVKDILERTKGNFDFGNGQVLMNSPSRIKFWQNSASYPYQSHDLWFLMENIRWGYLPPDTNTQGLINRVNREDLWREAARAIGQERAIPPTTSRGFETFYDGVRFDPKNPSAYLNSLLIKSIKHD